MINDNSATKRYNGKMAEKSSQNITNSNDSVHRPTEAQLRWAKMQHKTKARQMKERVSRLMQTPIFSHDVPGARADDDASTVVSEGGSSVASSSPLKMRKKMRPRVSRGRRALLKVSQRKYEKRRAAVQVEGFQHNSCDKENESDNNDHLSPDRKPRRNVPSRTSNQFQIAQAMLQSLGSSQKPDIIRSTKRWKRPENVSTNSVTNYQDWKWGLARRKRTENRRMTTALPFDRRASWLMHLPARSRSSTPAQYRLMFANQQSSDGKLLDPISLYDGREILSPCQLKFEEMVSRLQECDTVPTPGKDTIVSTRYLDQLPNSEPIESPRVVRRRQIDPHYHEDSFEQYEYRDARGWKSDFANQDDLDEEVPNLEQDNILHKSQDEKDEKLARVVRKPRNSIGERYEREHILKLQDDNDTEYATMRRTPNNTGDRYELEHFQQKQEAEALRIIRKSRHNIDIGKRYEMEMEMLREVKEGKQIQLVGIKAYQSPVSAFGHEDANNIKSAVRNSQKPHNVRNYDQSPKNPIQKRDNLSKTDSRIPNDQDIFDKEGQQYNMKQQDNATGISCSPVYSQKELGSIPEQVDQPNNNVHPSLHFDPETANPRDTVARYSNGLESVPSIGSSNSSLHIAVDPLLEPHQVSSKTPRTQSREQGALLDVATPTSTNSTEGSRVQEDEHSHVSHSSSFRSGAAKVAGGLFSLVTGRGSGANSDAGSEIRAIAAFRENRKTRNERLGQTDESSSVSSFRVLPEGIRKMVFREKNEQDPSVDKDVGFHSGPNLQNSSDIFNPPSVPTDLLSTNRSLNSQNSSEMLNAASDSADLLSSNRSAISALSPEHGKMIHQALIGDKNDSQCIIDTDGTTSDASGIKMDAEMIQSLLMSPTVLTKRHKQAIKAIERRNWQQIEYLVHANPWLAEMTDVTTEQYLLHKLALYGASKFLWSDADDTVDVIPAAPQQLNHDLIRLFPASVHKFDQDGNLPLHMAAASGNVEMTVLLGERFPSGASVRNNDGMLPLHLAIQACATPLADANGELTHAADFVAMILHFFPRALAVPDGEGDLPLHIAAAALEGELGVDVIYLLLDEADNQAKSENGLRFIERTRIKADEDSADDETIATEATTDPLSAVMEDGILHCNMIRNEMGRTALVKAIEGGSGWEVIEAIARGSGGVEASLWPNAEKCNALHLLLSEEYGDPQAALSILRVAPGTVAARNSEGILPIEIACRNEMPKEVIIAIALVDSPVELTKKEGAKIKEGFGGSWCFLTCESDDQYSDIVEEIISICTYDHLHELCFMKNESGVPMISRATPLCREILQRSLESEEDEEQCSI
mmetsp:Transcript_28825/g.44045  ORF Transcript_28825/g.44045 Transcript_28825/m.44045 type:complete len:1325 (+) Transcript_28825:3-3977(+)